MIYICIFRQKYWTGIHVFVFKYSIYNTTPFIFISCRILLNIFKVLLMTSTLLILSRFLQKQNPKIL